MQEVGCVVVVGIVIDVLVCLFRLCCIIGIVCGLLVGFQWSVEISWRMGLLEEQDGAVVGMFLPLPSSRLKVLITIKKKKINHMRACPVVCVQCICVLIN